MYLRMARCAGEADRGTTHKDQLGSRVPPNLLSFVAPFGVSFVPTSRLLLVLQELMSYPEASPYRFRLFTGEVMELFPDGSFTVDGNDCSGEAYTGVVDCE